MTRGGVRVCGCVGVGEGVRGWVCVCVCGGAPLAQVLIVWPIFMLSLPYVFIVIIISFVVFTVIIVCRCPHIPGSIR